MSRGERRKAQTRAALVRAAQQLLAAGLTEVSIQQITEQADVGFGSFYNHFRDKDELWKVAILEVLELQGDLIDQATSEGDDPAEVFCVGLRLIGRLAREEPELARVVLRGGTSYLLVDHGLMQFARRDVAGAVRAGRFDVTDVSLALATTGGALLGLLALLESDPQADAASLSDDLAERLLRAFGLDRAEAAEMVARPLPAVRDALAR
ncbi:TetR family transcriptional regulator [Modestobacter sp. I12A-02628]|uniref:TetR family transcriptional regulator n=1 Tax=Goekera deserti TaxID=2497753 RepID=A0A7K3WF85_9ACTN|nr:TetR family transcriptional regulator [Goekera deserti]NDI49799.1 TetR family transcriptional regulator [Goekera deserti]NEL55161.1 TetR family transcriptional regulator [Goekera deserti]